MGESVLRAPVIKYGQLSNIGMYHVPRHVYIQTSQFGIQLWVPSKPYAHGFAHPETYAVTALNSWQLDSIQHLYECFILFYFPYRSSYRHKCEYLPKLSSTMCNTNLVCHFILHFGFINIFDILRNKRHLMLLIQIHYCRMLS